MNSQFENENSMSAETAANYAEKENMLKMLRGEQPDWVPLHLDANAWLSTGITGYYYYMQENKVDMFGVEWVSDDAGEMPKPDRKMLDDITKWREFVSFPDLSKIDFEEMAKADLEYRDPTKLAMYCPYASGGQLFIPLMNMMGFEEGLCALIEEPEACHEMFTAATDIFEEIMRRQIPVYKPELIYLIDDLCSSTSPFISMDIFEEMFAPYYQRLINVAKEFNTPVIWHMCGKGDPIINRIAEMGVRMWEVAEPSNDLLALKKKYGNDFILVGGWDAPGIISKADVTEEYVRQSVRDAIDQLAPGGGYVFWSSGTLFGEKDVQVAAWAEDEARKYGHQFYRK